MNQANLSSLPETVANVISRSYQLNCDEKDCLKIELLLASLEEILKTGPEHVHDHNMELLGF